MNQRIKLVTNGADVGPLLWALQANEQLWNQDTERTSYEGSPHTDVDDIWVRYAADKDAKGPHESVWYPSAALLPVRQIIYPLMHFVRGERLGGVLITRVKAGKSVKPHCDKEWHAGYYEKFAVQVQSAPGQAFCFDNEQLSAAPGEVYWFDNSHMHWVTNDTPHDRITMIVCIKTDKG